VQFKLPVSCQPLNYLAVLPVSQQLQQKLPQLDLAIVAYMFHTSITNVISEEDNKIGPVHSFVSNLALNRLIFDLTFVASQELGLVMQPVCLY